MSSLSLLSILYSFADQVFIGPPWQFTQSSPQQSSHTTYFSKRLFYLSDSPYKIGFCNHATLSYLFGFQLEPLIQKGYQFRFSKDISTEALTTIWKFQYRTYLLIKPGWSAMMEKGFTCLVEITAVLSVLGLTLQVQGGAMIGEENLIFCTLSFA